MTDAEGYKHRFWGGQAPRSQARPVGASFGFQEGQLLR